LLKVNAIGHDNDLRGGPASWPPTPLDAQEGAELLLQFTQQRMRNRQDKLLSAKP